MAKRNLFVMLENQLVAKLREVEEGEYNEGKIVGSDLDLIWNSYVLGELPLSFPFMLMRVEQEGGWQ